MISLPYVCIYNSLAAVQYDHAYGHPPYLEDQPDHSSGPNSVTGQASLPLPGPSTQVEILEPERPRGRKRTRPQVGSLSSLWIPD